MPYAEQLTVGGVMCYIDIPKINVYLPIQHGTDADTLERAVGHVVGTSLPVGGSSNHAVTDAEQEAPPQPASTTPRPCSSQEELVGAASGHGARRSNLHSGNVAWFVPPWTFFH